MKGLNWKKWISAALAASMMTAAVPAAIPAQTDAAVPAAVPAQTDAAVPAAVPAQTDAAVPAAVPAQTDAAAAEHADTVVVLAPAAPAAVEALTPDSEKIEVFVTRLYRNFLLREPEQAGLEAWCNVLLEGKGTGATVVRGFVFSKEFQSLDMGNREYIEVFYRIILGREPDERGLQSWLSVLEQGFSRKKILEGFVNSQEMKRLCAEMGVEAGSYKSDDFFDRNYKVLQFVDRLYRIVLDREADSQGREYWVNALVDGEMNGFTIVMGFFTSQEMVDRDVSDFDYITICYRAILNREPDEDGYHQWLSELGGRGRLNVLIGMSKSQEFVNLCQQYGIKAFGAAFGTEFGPQFGRKLSQVRGDYGWLVKLDVEDGEAYSDGRVIIADETGDGKLNSLIFIGENEYTIKGVFYGQHYSEALSYIDRMGISYRDYDEDEKIQYLFISDYELYALHQTDDKLDYVYYFYDPDYSLLE